MEATGAADTSRNSAEYAEYYTIGWICAIQPEYEAAARMLDEEYDGPLTNEINDNNTYLYGRIGQHRLVIGCLPKGVYGISSATSVARDMVRSFPNMRFALMVGIGGGAPTRERDIRLGDVVVSCPQGTLGGVLQYDFGKRKDGRFERVGQLNAPPSILLQVLPELERRHNDPRKPDNIAEHMKLMDDMPGFQKPSEDRLYRSNYPHKSGNDCEKCGDDGVIDRSARSKARQISVYYGVIASANSLMKDAEERDQYANNPKLNILCFEMEAAGLMNNFPCLVVRGISDYSDSHKNSQWQKYAALAAAAYVKELLIVLKPQNVAGLEPLANKMQETLLELQSGFAKVARQTEGIRDHQKSQGEEAILDWLSQIDYAAEQSTSFGRRYQLTGVWLLHTDEFGLWMSERGKTLFCPGIPGAGKTILASVVIDHLQSRYRTDLGVGIAYIYCNFKQEQHDPKQMLRSLLRQLATRQGQMSEVVQTLHKLHGHRQTQPSFEDILQTLRTIASQYSRTFIVIDALDEYAASGGSREVLISAIFKIQSEAGANIFVTSRHSDDIASQFQGAFSVEIRAQDEDVERYLDGQMSQTDHDIWDNALQHQVKREIRKAADGMFLLVQLHAGNLLAMPTKGHIKEALRHLEKGLDGLNMLYKQALGRILSQDKANSRLALKILAWIVHARKTLSITELRHALAVRPSTKFDMDYLPSVRILRSKCAGLVMTDEQTGIVRLVHYTAQQYLERTSSDWFPDAQAVIARACITYLSFDAFSSICQSRIQIRERLKNYILYDYAALNWGYHAQLASSGDDLTLGFLRNASRLSSASQVIFVARYHDERYRRTLITGLHIAAHFGLDRAILNIEEKYRNLNVRDCLGQTPLSWAAVNGKEAIVRLLLSQDEIDVNPKDQHGETPLSLAARNGHEKVINLLIQRNHVNPTSQANTDYQKALFSAAGNGHPAVAKLLLEQNSVQADLKNEYGNTPLLLAAMYGHDAVIDIFIGRTDVDFNSKDRKFGRSALSWAIINGHEKVVQQLLRQNVDTATEDINGQNPLQLAAAYGHEVIVKLLVNHKEIDVNAKDAKFARTALSWAAMKGHEPTARFLLSLADVDRNSRDVNGQTPLSLAVEHKHEGVVKLLAYRDDVDKTARDGRGRTALLIAVGNSEETAVRLLLDRGDSGVNVKDGETGRTALSMAVAQGHEAIVRLLLNRNDVDTDSRDENGNSPLIIAAEYGYERIVTVLLATRGEIDINSTNNIGQSALSLAAKRDHTAVVKLLVSRDDIHANLKSFDGWTPLAEAALRGNEATVNALVGLDKVDVNLTISQHGWSPLSVAIINMHPAVVTLLLNRSDIDINLVDNDGNNPLSLAVIYGDSAIWSSLIRRLRAGFESIRDECGRTPLALVAQNGNRPAVSMLLGLDNVDPNSRDTQGRTPLALAARHARRRKVLVKQPDDENIWIPSHGHEAVIRLLLSRDDVDANSRDFYGKTPLALAAKRGNVAAVDLLLGQANVDPNIMDMNGRTPLSLATEKGHASVVSLLLQREDIKADLKDNNGVTPLMLAARCGDEEIIYLLLVRQDVDPNSKTNYGGTPLFFAAYNGHANVVELLIEQEGVNPDARDDDCASPLIYAARNGHSEVVKLLLSQDVDVDSRDNHGDSPLILATILDHGNVVELLLNDRRVNANLRDGNGQSPLTLAAERGHANVVELLLNHKNVDVNSRNEIGGTPLSTAAFHGHNRIVELLLKQESVDAGARDKFGCTPLIIAAYSGHWSVISLLLGRDDVQINSWDVIRESPLSWASIQGHDAVVELLLNQENISADSKDILGRAPISWAACNGHERIVRLLISRDDVDPDSRDRRDRTPLSYAAMCGHETIAELLVNLSNVEKDSKDNVSFTPLLWASKQGHVKMVKLLLDQKADANSRDKNGWTALSWAAMNGNSMIADIVLKQDNINVNSGDRYGRTALCLAAMMGKKETVRLLLHRQGVKKHIKDAKGRSALWWAARRKHKSIVRLLQS